MEKSLFIGSFRGTEENLERFILSPIFSFGGEAPGKISILCPFDFVLKKIKSYGSTNRGIKEIFSIEMESDEIQFSKNVEYVRDEAMRCKVDIDLEKENLQEMKIEYIFIHYDGDVCYMLENLDTNDLI